MMLDRLSSYIKEHQLWTSDDKLLLAVSGGVDSMVLAHLIHASGFSFGIAHVNYHLRGADSDADEALVKRWATEEGVSCHIKQTTIDTSKENVQERAREIRYTFFQTCCDQHGYTKVLTAHHLDDRVETSLMNLMRGTGIYGLKGLPKQRDNIVRPMRWASKEEIEAYAASHKIPFLTDRSNESGDYMRNRVRKEVMPALKQLDEDVLQRLEGSLDRLETDAEVLRLLAHARLTAIGDAHVVRLEENEQPWWAGLLYHAFRLNGVNRAEAEEMAQGSVGARWEKSDYTFVRSSQHISRLPSTPPPNEQQSLTLEGQVKHPNGMLLCTRYTDQQPTFDASNKRVWLSLSADRFPLQVRNLHAGDQFVPLGLSYAVDARKYLLEKGASYAHLRHAVVVCDASGKICWIPGWQVSEEFKWQAKHEHIVSLSFEPNGD